MAPRNLRKRQPADSDDEEDGAGAVGLQSLQERIEDARTLIKNRAKNKVRRQKQDLVGLLHSTPLAPPLKAYCV